MLWLNTLLGPPPCMLFPTDDDDDDDIDDNIDDTYNDNTIILVKL